MLYLSSILDLYNGEMVDYSIADWQNTSLVLDTHDQLPEILLHSDQGSVYTTLAYQTVVKEKGITMSCPVKGRPLVMPPQQNSRQPFVNNTKIVSLVSVS